MWRISHSSAEIIGPFVAWAARVVCLTWLLPWTSHKLSHVQRSFKSQLTRKVPSISQRVRKVNALKVNLFVFSFLGEVTGFMSRIPMRNLRKTMMASKVWQEKTWIPWVHPNHLDIPVLSRAVKSRLLPPRPGLEPSRRGLSSWMLTGRLA